MSTREVWVTGLGVISAAGEGIDALSRALRSSVTAATMPATGEYWLGRAPEASIGREGKRLDRSARFFLASAREAWRRAGLEAADFDHGRAAVLEGSSVGPMADLLSSAQRRATSVRPEPVRPSDLVRQMLGAGGAAFAQEMGLEGAVYLVSAGSISAALAVAEGFWKIQLGLADIVVAGGAECPLHADIINTFASAGVLANAGTAGAPCRPFDIDRCGTMLGEGGSALVLEDAAHARARGATPLAVIVGAGLTCESAGMTSPDPSGRGVSTVVTQALMGTDRNSLGWVKAHGTGTRANDAAELRGLAAALGEGLGTCPVTSLKPLLGHCLGASGGIEAVATILALGDGIVPPTLGTTRLDPELPRCLIPIERLPARAPVALLLSESFGGRCAALALRQAA